MRILGLDVGGANLKAADTDGNAVTRPFAVWKSPDHLAAEIDQLFAGFKRPDGIAVTMTAELADCYRTKSDGVNAILDAVEFPAGSIPVVVWQTDGRFCMAGAARRTPQLVAAANWHALATFVGRLVEQGSSLLIDIGTTTTDLIPLKEGVPVPLGRTDRQRLQSGELVYTGVRRTPLCAIVPAVPFRGGNCPLAAELFATTLDVYLTLGDLPENPRDTETANGRPATIDEARDRLARSLCADSSEFTRDDAAIMCQFVAQAQRRQIAECLDQVIAARAPVPSRVILSGAGSFLAEHTLHLYGTLAAAETIRLAELLGPEIAETACAFAVARLAAELRPF